MRLSQKRFLRLIFVQLQRRAENDPADHGYRQELSLGEYPVQVREMYWHKLNVGPPAPQVIDPAFEWSHLQPVAPRAFGKNNQRMSLFQSFHKLFQSIARGCGAVPFYSLPSALHQHRMECVYGNPLPQP